MNVDYKTNETTNIPVISHPVLHFSQQHPFHPASHAEHVRFTCCMAFMESHFGRMHPISTSSCVRGLEIALNAFMNVAVVRLTPTILAWCSGVKALTNL